MAADREEQCFDVQKSTTIDNKFYSKEKIAVEIYRRYLFNLP